MLAAGGVWAEHCQKTHSWGNKNPSTSFFSVRTKISGYLEKQLKNTPEISTRPCIFFSHLRKQCVTEQHELKKLVTKSCRRMPHPSRLLDTCRWLMLSEKERQMCFFLRVWWELCSLSLLCFPSVQWLPSGFPWLTTNIKTVGRLFGEPQQV